MSREAFARATPARLELRGLTLAPAQTMGAVRIVPVVRPPDRELVDLRLARRDYDEPIGVAALGGGAPTRAGLSYASFIPHGLVVSFAPDGSPVAAQGAQLGRVDGVALGGYARLFHRMVKREASDGGVQRVRMLPLHLALEGFLALHFNGPDVLWREYSQQAASRGLDPRSERAVRGAWLPGLEEAIRTFEILPAQVGVLVFVADALACALVVPHADDYRALHAAVLDDLFGELLRTYALLYPQDIPAHAALDAAGATTLAELAARVARVRADWQAYAELLAAGLFERDVRVEQVRALGRYRLERFVPVFDPELECHLGERIVRADGELAYLKTFRLSAAQIRRAHLLDQLAEARWHLGDAAARLRTTVPELTRRLASAGLDFLLRPSVLEALPRGRR